MSTPAAKRRRIDAATALSKPFRSPFKTPFKTPLKRTSTSTPTTNDALTANKTLTDTPSISTKGGTTVLASKTPNTLLSRRPGSLLDSKTPKLLANNSVPRKKYTSPVSAATLNTDKDIAPLLKVQRELERTLREVKEELDAAEQALKIESESRRKARARNEEDGIVEGGEEWVWDGEIDGELVALMGKWRGASQLAAEELFGGVRDRVNRMGGPRAWKEAQKKQQEYQNGWDQEDSNQNNDNDDDDDGEKPEAEKRDVYAEYGIDPETENEKSQRAKGVGDTGEIPGEEDEFTMAMMLRTLNVDLDIIGYDREGQRWID